MREKIIVIFICLAIFARLYASIIYVATDQSTIQDGINAAADGDTVLVADNTYVENINFNGKLITVASYFLLDGDSTHISNTIIDGDSSGSVVIFENGEDSTAVLAAFTIKNGAADIGGGIYGEDANPRLENLFIQGNTAESFGGGLCFIQGQQTPLAPTFKTMVDIHRIKSPFDVANGVVSSGSGPKIFNVTISGNTSYFGGGICFGGLSTPEMKNVRITKNNATLAGGICSFGADPVMSNVSIHENEAEICGGLYFSTNAPTFDTQHRCNIYLNYARMATDILTEPENDIFVPIVLDTFTVKYPTDFYAFPAASFSFNILHYRVEQVTGDLYIDPVNGDNLNTGTSAADPLRTIFRAISILAVDSLSTSTLYLAEGTFCPSNGESFPIILPSYISLSGASMDDVVLDAEEQTSVLELQSAQGRPEIENLTITRGAAGGINCHSCSPRLTNLRVINNISYDEGGGILCHTCPNVSLENLIVAGNTSHYRGGGIACRASNLILSTVTLTDNMAFLFGGGISCVDSSAVTLEMSTIDGNVADFEGGGLYCDNSDFMADSLSFFENAASESGGGIYTRYANVELNRCTFEENNAVNGHGGAFYFYNDDLAQNPVDTFYVNIHESRIINNTSLFGCAGIGIRKMNYEESNIKVWINNCEFHENSSDFYTALQISGDFIHFKVNNSTFTKNTAKTYVAAAGISASAKGLVSNCLFTQNRAATSGEYSNSGGSSVWSGATVDFMNCTIAENSAAYGAGLTVGGGGNATATNCIFWGNSPDQLALDTWNNSGGLLALNYCDVQDGKDAMSISDLSYLAWGSGNMDADPQFVSNSTPYDFHLSDESPCISAGVDSIWGNGHWIRSPVTDIEGNPRPNPANTNPDIGAFENAHGTLGSKIPAGAVQGAWIKSRSPYLVQGSVFIPNGETLIIEPGVDVIFAGYYVLDVDGQLLAVGTEHDSIRFSPQNSETGWQGIRFDGTSVTNDSSKIVYCLLENGKASGQWPDHSGGAIRLNEVDKLRISHCLLAHNSALGQDASGGAICLWNSNPVISHNTIIHNQSISGGGIICWEANPLIAHNVIGFNDALGGVGGGICTFNGAKPSIIGNILFKNTADFGGGINSYQATPTMLNNLFYANEANGGGGILCNGQSNAILINNTIVDNTAEGGAGITCGDASSPLIVNTIIYGNSNSAGTPVQIWDDACKPCFYNCDVQGNLDPFEGENNIRQNPLFSMHPDSLYHLTAASPCIGMGLDTLMWNGQVYYAPATDLFGHSRPNPAHSKPDIGAIESDRQYPSDIKSKEGQVPLVFAFYQNYPNPFNSTTVLAYDLPRTAHVQLTIYDVLGRQVKQLVDMQNTAGQHTIIWDATNDLNKVVPAGLYFCRMQAEEFVKVNKLAVIK